MTAGPFVPTVNDPPLQAIMFDLKADPFWVLVACVLLNCTSRHAVNRVWPALMAAYPTPDHLAWADRERLTRVIERLGFGVQRAHRLKDLAMGWLDYDDPFIGYATHWPLDVTSLPDCGTYAQESWDVFVRRDYRLPCSDRVVESWRLKLREIRDDADRPGWLEEWRGHVTTAYRMGSPR